MRYGIIFIISFIAVKEKEFLMKLFQESTSTWITTHANDHVVNPWVTDLVVHHQVQALLGQANRTIHQMLMSQRWNPPNLNELKIKDRTDGPGPPLQQYDLVFITPSLFILILI
jgi:hypothetical protein